MWSVTVALTIKTKAFHPKIRTTQDMNSGIEKENAGDKLIYSYVQLLIINL